MFVEFLVVTDSNTQVVSECGSPLLPSCIIGIETERFHVAFSQC